MDWQLPILLRTEFVSVLREKYTTHVGTVSQEIVDRFGRYPQRNKVLGRENTPEEAEWLANPPPGYTW